MKNVLVFCLFLLAGSVQAQVSLGLKAGVNFPANKADDIVVSNGNNSFNLGVDKVHYGLQFGGFLRLGERVFVQPEVLFNSNRTDYRVESTDAQDVILSERYNTLNFPLLIGISRGPITLHAGPVGHYFLNSTSELTDIDGYEARFDDLTWGWTAGLGLGKGRLSADLRYEGNFRKQGDHITFAGERYAFSNSPGRFVANLNYRLFGK